MSAWTWILDKCGYQVKWEAHKLGRWSDGSLTGFMSFAGRFDTEAEAYAAAGAGEGRGSGHREGTGMSATQACKEDDMRNETKEAVAAVEQGAALADNSPRVIEHMEIGQYARQGDVYLHRVAETHPRGALRTGNEARQLAIGLNENARHIAEPPAVVYEGTMLPPTCAPRTFLGPVVVGDQMIVVSHPEHAAVHLPRGCYQVTHQMDARTLERVQD